MQLIIYAQISNKLLSEIKTPPELLPFTTHKDWVSMDLGSQTDMKAVELAMRLMNQAEKFIFLCDVQDATASAQFLLPFVEWFKKSNIPSSFIKKGVPHSLVDRLICQIPSERLIIEENAHIWNELFECYTA